jgi:phospholipase C
MLHFSIGSRRAAILASLASLAALGCSSSSSGGSAAPEAGTPEFDAGPRIDDTTAQTGRAACKFARGALPAQTIGASTPIGPAIPIDHIVVVMMENHSFDSYLGHLNKYGNRTDIESAPAAASNPDGDAGPQPWIHAPHLCSLDTDHGWDGTHFEIDNGAMDGFASRNESTPLVDGGAPPPGNGGRALWWYDETDLPLYYQLANTFAVADHYFCAVPGPTWPNRRFLYAATSWGGTVTNLPAVLPTEPTDLYPGNPVTVLDELESSKTTWMYYSDGILPTLSLLTGSPTTRWKRNPVAKFAAFQAAAKAGKLPSVSFVDPPLALVGSGAEADEHPPGDIQIGQKLVSDVVQAVLTSPQWSSTALFITHDEHGGFYDHVPPPSACAPDDIKPVLVNGETADGGFDLEGVRVVLIAVSPYARKGFVGKKTYDHTSITRFIETRFNLPALTKRDANADPLTDLFDFKNPPFTTAPSIPPATIDQAGYDYCTANFGDGGP